jgi:hypothetical protein
VTRHWSVGTTGGINLDAFQHGVTVADMLREIADADRSEAQLPAAGKLRQTSETVSKRNGPSDLCPCWGPFFISSK